MEFYRMLHAWTRRKETEARILAAAVWRGLEPPAEGQAGSVRSSERQANGYQWVSPEEIFARAGVKF
jgi:hypothetical protein